MKLTYFGLKVRLFLQINFGSGFESGSKTFISVPDRIRIRPQIFGSLCKYLFLAVILKVNDENSKIRIQIKIKKYLQKS
jgi:hypothetical protein